MMNVRELVDPTFPSAAHRTPWFATASGAASSLALAGAFLLLGLWLGAVHVPPGGLLGSLGLRATSWLALTGALAFLCGGWITSRIAGLGRPSDSVILGLVSWAAGMLGAFAFIGVVDRYVSPIALAVGPGSQAAAFAGRAFLIMAFDCAASCLGAREGTRLVRSVTVDEYQRSRKHAPPAPAA